jgi:hypothetical protein
MGRLGRELDALLFASRLYCQDSSMYRFSHLDYTVRTVVVCTYVLVQEVRIGIDTKFISCKAHKRGLSVTKSNILRLFSVHVNHAKSIRTEEFGVD